VTTKEDNGFKTETTLSDDLKAIRIYEFTDTGMVVVSVILIKITMLYKNDPVVYHNMPSAYALCVSSFPFQHLSSNKSDVKAKRTYKRL